MLLVYLNFRYESFKIQFEMAIDRQYNKDYSARDIDWINSIKTSYPSLGLFTMPLLSQKGIPSS